MSHRGIGFLVLVCTGFLSLSAFADDFAPPPWDRAHPRAITAEWEFLTPANPALPDGPLTNVGTKGSGSVPTSAFIGAGGLGWGIGDGDGGWFFPTTGAIEFTVDNVIDHEPVKRLWVQVTHTPGLALSLDTLPGINIGATGSAPSPVTVHPVSPIYTIFAWEMFPNPPFEYFTLLVGGPGEIDQIVVDTISFPEPASALVLTAGLFIRRRSR